MSYGTETSGRRLGKPSKVFWLALGCAGVLCVLMVLGLGGVFWSRTLIYTGTGQDKSRMAALPWEVRQSLPVLPEGAQDIHYSVMPYPPAEVKADFRIPRGGFLR